MLLKQHFKTIRHMKWNHQINIQTDAVQVTSYMVTVNHQHNLLYVYIT